jgi:hypothetical protein
MMNDRVAAAPGDSGATIGDDVGIMLGREASKTRTREQCLQRSFIKVLWMS